jgi:integrase
MRRALGLPERYTPYSLRHFVATRLILQGKEEIQVAKFLGTSVDMLQKVYANHLDHAAQRDIGEAVTNLF